MRLSSLVDTNSVYDPNSLYYIEDNNELLEILEFLERGLKDITIHLMSKQVKLSFSNEKPVDSNVLKSFHSNLDQFYEDQIKQQLSFPIRLHNFEHMSPYLKHYLNNFGDP